MIRSENDLKNACLRVFSEGIIHTTIVYQKVLTWRTQVSKWGGGRR